MQWKCISIKLAVAGLLFPELKWSDVMGMLYVISSFQTYKINPAIATLLSGRKYEIYIFFRTGVS